MQDLTPNCTGGILWKNQCEADPFGSLRLKLCTRAQKMAVIDLSNPANLVSELFDPDEEVRKQFANRFSAQSLQFSEILAPAFARFSKLSSECHKTTQDALTCGFVHGVLDDLVTSTKLLLTGKLTASGNLFRQAIEGICMATMCSHSDTLCIGDREHSYWKLVETEDKMAEGHRAPTQLLKNYERLGVMENGAEQLKAIVSTYNKHSHAGVVAMACRMELRGEGMIFIGGHFDEGKIAAYEAELFHRIELAKQTVQMIDVLREKLRHQHAI
jgi:hypothetical protein